MLKRLPIPLLIAAAGLLVLPYLLLALGLTMTSASEVVIFATACMALNILVGHTGLVSFGHGAWFGLAAYAAALLQRNWMQGSFFGPDVAPELIDEVPHLLLHGVGRPSSPFCKPCSILKESIDFVARPSLIPHL